LYQQKIKSIADMKLNKSEICTIANKMDRNISRSEAFRKAWAIVKLRQAMQQKVVEFTYQKKDGSIRRAIGTTSGRFFSYESKGGYSSPKVVTYYDMEKKAFRSFRNENIVAA